MFPFILSRPSSKSFVLSLSFLFSSPPPFIMLSWFAWLYWDIPLNLCNGGWIENNSRRIDHKLKIIRSLQEIVTFATKSIYNDNILVENVLFHSLGVLLLERQKNGKKKKIFFFQRTNTHGKKVVSWKSFFSFLRFFDRKAGQKKFPR